MTDGRTLRMRRMERGLTQRQVAAMIGKTQAQISEVECGKAYASPDIAAKMAEALWKEERAAEAEHLQREKERIERQEALWDAIPDGPEKRALLADMLDRAYDLMKEGDGTQADAICDYLPKADVLAMFDRWESDSINPAAETPPEAPAP